jgi:hypothetical protein
MDLAQCGLKRDAGLMQEYEKYGCGKNVPLENCLYYKYRLKQNPKDAKFKALMENAKCDDVLKAYQNETVLGVYNTYSALDKQRIEAESKYERNKKLFFGGMVFLVVVGILLVRKK